MDLRTRLGLTGPERRLLVSQSVVVTCTVDQEAELQIEWLRERIDFCIDSVEGIIYVPYENHLCSFIVCCKDLDPDPAKAKIYLTNLKEACEFEKESVVISEEKTVEVSSKVWMLEESEKVFLQQVISNICNAVVNGECIFDDWLWWGNPKYQLTSTPIKPDSEVPKEETLRIGAAQLKLETELEKMRTQILDLHARLIEKDKIVPDDLSKTMTEHSGKLIEELATKGILSGRAPQIHAQFSGDRLKGDTSYEVWEFEVRQLMETHKEQVILQAITKSLKGSALQSLTSSCNITEMTVKQVLAVLKRKFGISSTYDTLASRLYSAYQRWKEGEKTTQFTTRIECIIREIQIRFPEKIPDEATRLKWLRERYEAGCAPYLAANLTHYFDDPTKTYFDIVDKARELEAAEDSRQLFEGINADRSDKKSNGKKGEPVKAQAKAEIVSTDPTFTKLLSLVKSCETEQAVSNDMMKTLNQAFKDFEQRNNSYHVPYEQRSQTGRSSGQGQNQNQSQFQNQGQQQQQQRGPNFNNPNPRYFGNRYDPNYIPPPRGRGRGNGRGGGRGRGQRAPVPDQSANFQYFNNPTPNQGFRQNNPNQNQNQAQNVQNPNQNIAPSNNDGNQSQRRQQPYCPTCISRGFPSTDHYPSQCEYTNAALRAFEQAQQANGHQNQTQNLNNGGL